jgi:hypothetical protein
LARGPSESQQAIALIADHFYGNEDVSFEWALAIEAPSLEELPEHPGKHYSVVTFEWRARTRPHQGDGELPGTEVMDDAIPVWINARISERGDAITVRNIAGAVHGDDSAIE